MASTTFVDGSTVIVASWLNDVNNAVYNGVFQSSTASFTGSVTTPVVKSTSTVTLQSNTSGVAFYGDTSQNVGLGTNSLISGFKVTAPGAIIANGSMTAYGSDPSLSSGSSRVFMDFSGSVGRIGTATGTGAGGTLAFTINNSNVATLDGSGNFSANGNVSASGNVVATGQFSGPGTGLTGTATSLSIGGNAATATTAANGGVTSVNGLTGAVTLTPTVYANGTYNTNTTYTISVSGTRPILLTMQYSGGQASGATVYGDFQWGIGSLANTRVWVNAGVNYQVTFTPTLSVLVIPSGSGTLYFRINTTNLDGNYGAPSNMWVVAVQN